MMKIYDDVLKKAVETYGIDAQCGMCVEECAELIQALRKYDRDPSEERMIHVCEEIADVKIMIRQLEMMFDEVIIDSECTRKVGRLQERLGDAGVEI